MLNNTDHNRIERYLGGAMDAKETLEFENELLENETLREELRLFDAINHHLADEVAPLTNRQTEYAQELRDFLQSDEAKQIQERLQIAKKTEDKTNQYKIYRLAAVLVLGLILGGSLVWISKPATAKELFLEYYQTDDLPSYAARNDKALLPQKVSESFKKGDYKNSLAFFDQYAKSGQAIDTSLFLVKGAAHLALDENKSAINSFKIVSNSLFLDKEKGLWFLALAYLKVKEKDSAKATLHKIAFATEHFKQKEASELLKQLE